MADKKKILIIDDEKDLCRMLKMNLETTGEFELTTAYSGEEGLEKAKEIEFDLVITDYKLPGISGNKVLESLKAAKPHLPVILFSIYHDDAASINSSTRSQADGLISKPFGHKEIYNKIKEVLARSQKA